MTIHVIARPDIANDTIECTCGAVTRYSVEEFAAHRRYLGLRSANSNLSNQWSYQLGRSTYMDKAPKVAKPPRPIRPTGHPRRTEYEPEWADVTCPNGHTGTWRRNKRGHRECLGCRRVQQAEYREQRRVA